MTTWLRRTALLVIVIIAPLGHVAVAQLQNKPPAVPPITSDDKLTPAEAQFPHIFARNKDGGFQFPEYQEIRDLIDRSPEAVRNDLFMSFEALHDLDSQFPALRRLFNEHPELHPNATPFAPTTILPDEIETVVQQQLSRPENEKDRQQLERRRILKGWSTSKHLEKIEYLNMVWSQPNASLAFLRTTSNSEELFKHRGVFSKQGARTGLELSLYRLHASAAYLTSPYFALADKWKPLTQGVAGLTNDIAFEQLESAEIIPLLPELLRQQNALIGKEDLAAKQARAALENLFVAILENQILSEYLPLLQHMFHLHTTYLLKLLGSNGYIKDRWLVPHFDESPILPNQTGTDSNATDQLPLPLTLGGFARYYEHFASPEEAGTELDPPVLEMRDLYRQKIMLAVADEVSRTESLRSLLTHPPTHDPSATRTVALPSLESIFKTTVPLLRLAGENKQRFDHFVETEKNGEASLLRWHNAALWLRTAANLVVTTDRLTFNDYLQRRRAEEGMFRPFGMPFIPVGGVNDPNLPSIAAHFQDASSGRDALRILGELKEEILRSCPLRNIDEDHREMLFRWDDIVRGQAASVMFDARQRVDQIASPFTLKNAGSLVGTTFVDGMNGAVSFLLDPPMVLHVDLDEEEADTNDAERREKRETAMALYHWYHPYEVKIIPFTSPMNQHDYQHDGEAPKDLVSENTALAYYALYWRLPYLTVRNGEDKREAMMERLGINNPNAFQMATFLDELNRLRDVTYFDFDLDGKSPTSTDQTLWMQVQDSVEVIY